VPLNPTASAHLSRVPPVPAPEDVAKPPPDAVRSASGLSSKVLVKGTGKERPHENDRVKIHYTGWTTDGRMSASTVGDGRPLEIGMPEMPAGWREALRLMVEHEKRRLWVPAGLGYAGAGDMVFDLELLQIFHVPEALPVPRDVAAVPKSAIKTASGLAYRVLEKGRGKGRPGANDTVTFHYTGWTPDGTQFDSSRMRGKPARIMLQHVIAGWREGLQLMTIGDRFRFWIPAALAYGDDSKLAIAPPGPVVFDIELLDFGGHGHDEHGGHEH
jgi:FKBP-type peptidyl-prolyl cis-trans isomerase